MSLRRCADCTTEYAVDLTGCPHCGSPKGEEIGGPSYLDHAAATEGTATAVDVPAAKPEPAKPARGKPEPAGTDPAKA